jgi:hypothetical protein
MAMNQARDAEPAPCVMHQCLHATEAECNGRCQTDEDLLEQVRELRRRGWSSEPGGAYVVTHSVDEPRRRPSQERESSEAQMEIDWFEKEHRYEW